MQRIQDKLQSFFSIVAEYNAYNIDNITGQMVHDMLNRYKNKQFGKNFDKDIYVQQQVVYYWQKVVCKPIFVEKLYIGFVSSLNKSATYHIDIFEDLNYINPYDTGNDPTKKDSTIKFNDESSWTNNMVYSKKLYALIMDHLFENLRAEFAYHGILPGDPLEFGLDPEYLYLLFNTCTKIIDGKPMNVPNTDNIQIDPTSDDYKNKIVIKSQRPGKEIPTFIQDQDINPHYQEGAAYDYSKLNSGRKIYFENKETLVNACKLFLYLYRKKTCVKYMKKAQNLDKVKYNTLNQNAPQEISFIEMWVKNTASGKQISKDAYNEMIDTLTKRSSFGTVNVGGLPVAGITPKEALDNVLISLNINIPTDPPDNQTYRLCKISGMPPILGSPDMIAAAKKAKLTAMLGEDASTTDADRSIQQKALGDATARNEAAIAAGIANSSGDPNSEKFTNIEPPKVVEGYTNQIENLFTGIVTDVKLFFGYIIVMILVVVLCYALLSISPPAFEFAADMAQYLFKIIGDICTILFTGLGLSISGMVDISSATGTGLVNMFSMVLNICFAVLKDFGYSIYSLMSVLLFSLSTIFFAGLNYITQQVLNFAQLTFGETEWLAANGFNFMYQQTLSFIDMISTTTTGAAIFVKDQLMNFFTVSSGTGATFFTIMYQLILLFFTIIFTLISLITTLLLSSIAFILNFFLGTTTNIVQTLYNYSSDQIDIFVKLAFGSSSSLFKIIYELILLIGKLVFASLYTLVEVLLSVIGAVMKLILGSSSNLMSMILNFITLITTLLKNVGSGFFLIIYDIFSFLAKTIGALPGMSFTYVANLFANVFSKFGTGSGAGAGAAAAGAE